MTFKDYDDAIGDTPDYPGKGGKNIVYPALGLVGEAGEAADKIKKIWRNHNITWNPKIALDGFETSNEEATQIENLRLGVIKELGDVLWYLNDLSKAIGSSLEEVAQLNIDKLLDRRKRGVIKSEGDNR